MKEYYDEYWNRTAPPPTQDPLAATRSNRLWRLVDSLPTPIETFLDAGCGTGQLVGQAADRGLKATGVDISSRAFDPSICQKPGVKMLEHSLESLPWPLEGESQDIVSCFEVIEHVLKPADLVAGISAVLRPGGYVAITTPYHGRIKNIAIALTNFDKHFDVNGDHIRFFSDRSLTSLLDQYGFRTERVIHYGRFRWLWAGVMVWAKKT